MKQDADSQKFQEAVDKYLVRHQSILDVLSKLEEAASRNHRAIIKSVTSCGCLKIHAEKQSPPSDITLGELQDYMDTHLEGKLCDDCLDIIETELGNTLFYLTGMCNILDINLQDVINKEYTRLKTLGIYNML